MAEATVRQIAPADGKLGVLCVGLGAVATTFIAGVENARRGAARPIGSVTQMGTIRLGKRTEQARAADQGIRAPGGLDDLVFGAWDPFPTTPMRPRSMPACWTGTSTSSLSATSSRASSRCPRSSIRLRQAPGRQEREAGQNKRDLAEALRKDIRDFKTKNKCSRLVMVWCASTEIFISPGPAHRTLEAFEKAIDANDPTIAPSMLYAYAAMMEGVPFANGAPNLTVDFPAMEQLAKSNGVPIGGKDFKTGQTLIKTVLSPMFKARMLGVAGWYSTNILGNRDGEVLDDPESFKTKEESKLGVLEYILQPQLYPELYGNMYHKVRINYYPPRGDNKEGWDNIDIFGWLGYPMQIKVDFLCRDSILAAPLVLDLALFFDLAQRAGLTGIQEWLSFYFKSPQARARALPRARPLHSADSSSRTRFAT